MSGVRPWTEFEGVVEPLTWGRNTYVVLRLPHSLESTAKTMCTRRVEGILDEVEVNLGINRADTLGEAFAYLGPALRRRLHIRAGDVLRCRLRPADPSHVPIADDVRAALEADSALDAFHGRTPGERRRLLQHIEDAATEATRQRRTNELIGRLKAE